MIWLPALGEQWTLQVFFCTKHDVMKIDHEWKSDFARIEGAFTASTMRPYDADVEHSESEYQAQSRQPLPISVDALCRYLQADAIVSSAATVRRRMSLG